MSAKQLKRGWNFGILEFWRKTHTPLWLLIGRIIFLTLEKTSFAIVIGLFFCFVRVKNIVRSSDWLELICV